MHKDYKWTLEEALEECKEMEKGKKHMTEDYIAKVGTIRPCAKCGKPTDIITYTNYDMDWMSITHCSNCYENPFDKIQKCHDLNCGVHSKFNEKESFDKEEDYLRLISEIKKMLNEVKPTSDSILEYDRICHLFGHSHPHTKPADYDFFLYREFINYMGLNNKLRV